MINIQQCHRSFVRKFLHFIEWLLKSYERFSKSAEKFTLMRANTPSSTTKTIQKCLLRFVEHFWKNSAIISRVSVYFLRIFEKSPLMSHQRQQLTSNVQQNRWICLIMLDPLL